MAFKPQRRGQYEPVTSTSSRDCVPTTTAQLINRATVDRVRVDHDDIRRVSGAPSSRGLYMSEAIDAARHYGVTLTGAYGISREDLKDLLVAGHAVGLLINCAITRYTTRRTNFYTGPHCVYVQSYNYWPAGEKCACELQTASAHGEFTIEDPGTTSVGYQQWSAGLAYRAAESYGGGAAIYALVAPDTENVRRTAQGGPWYTAPYRSKPKKGKQTPGSRYTVTNTVNGGGWPRSDGSTAYGWHRVPGELYAPGEDLR